MNFAKIALKCAALALSAMVLLTACDNVDEKLDADAKTHLKAKSVSLGYDHSAAIAEDGSLYMWGDNRDGELGTGDKKESTTPIKIMDHVSSVTLAGCFSTAITEDGSLYTWGSGPLGYETETDEESSTPVKILDHVVAFDFGKRYASPSISVNYCAAITEDGSLYTWGNNTSGQLGNRDYDYSYFYEPFKIMEHVKSVSLSVDYSAAITEDGTLYLWGSANNGRLGYGNGAITPNEPIKIMDHVKSVSLGETHSAAITEDGCLYMWGSNWSGEIGTEEDIEYVPVKVMEHVKSVYLGSHHSAAITEDGSLYMWGDNSYGQLGNEMTDGKSKPTKIMDHVKSFYFYDESYHHDCFSAAITEDGSLYMWGVNQLGRFGEGADEDTAYPVKVMEHVASVSFGAEHNAVITEDGDLYTWGQNTMLGPLGIGGTTDKYTTPQLVSLLPQQIKGKK